VISKRDLRAVDAAVGSMGRRHGARRVLPDPVAGLLGGAAEIDRGMDEAAKSDRAIAAIQQDD
jgi:hypothetical protein